MTWRLLKCYASANREAEASLFTAQPRALPARREVPANQLLGELLTLCLSHGMATDPISIV